MTESSTIYENTFVSSELVNVSLFWVNTSSSPALVSTSHSSAASGGISEAIVPMYVAIFLLAVIGNALVVVTLVQNKRMRTVTNVYLLNLVSSWKYFKAYTEGYT